MHPMVGHHAHSMSTGHLRSGRETPHIFREESPALDDGEFFAALAERGMSGEEMMEALK